MRVWVDEASGCKMCEPDCADEWLDMIWCLGVDYDGYTTVEGLRSLVDELVEMSQKARRCLQEGKIFPSEPTSASAASDAAPITAKGE